MGVSKNEKKRKIERKEKKKHKYVGCFLDNIEVEEALNENVTELLDDKHKPEKKKKRNKNNESMELEHFIGEGLSDIKEVGEKEERSERKKKKRKKGKRLEDKEVGKNYETDSLMKHGEEEEEVIFDTKCQIVNVKEKKKKNEKRVTERSNIKDSDMDCSDQVASKGKSRTISSQEPRKENGYVAVGIEKNVEYINEGRNNRKKEKYDKGSVSKDTRSKKSNVEEQTSTGHKEVACSDSHSGSSSNKKRGREEEVFNVEMGKKEKKKKKKKKTMEGVDKSETENRGENITDHSKNSESKKPSKRVTFSDHVEVVTLSDDTVNEEVNREDILVRGKRFSKEEDEIVKHAVLNYIETHGLGEKGLDMVMQSKKFPSLRHCWKQIGAFLPWRPYIAVYFRAHSLFERAEKRGWTEEEKTLIKEFHKKHGSNWKDLARYLGKNRYHLKDTWRRIKPPDLKKGRWSQEEYQSLFDSVNMDLRAKVLEEKKSKHGMLRDNITWSLIGEKMTTRTNMSCCNKWYTQLTSSMVKAGEWADADDYRLLDELLKLDACCLEDVDWDNLLVHRSGYICLKRWKQMVNHIGGNRNLSFAEQVDVLAKRYCPELLDTREAFDNRACVP